ncbi:hypothetical protein [Spiroplasma endosymbiont of Stenodema calcarata]|uniref:hypothetical protein n=1 Tax=Spiroplasma endosymbiont of Stenodema calcarata TaxID=3139328 RepID=UPI003CCAED28
MNLVDNKNKGNKETTVKIPKYVLNFVDLLDDNTLIKSKHFSDLYEDIISEKNYLVEECGYTPEELEIVNLSLGHGSFTSYEEWQNNQKKIESDPFFIKINELINKSDENLRQWENDDEPYNYIDDGQEHHNEMGFNAGLNYSLKIYKEVILNNQEQADNTKNYIAKLEKIAVTLQEENEKLKESLKITNKEYFKLKDKNEEFSR